MKEDLIIKAANQLSDKAVELRKEADHLESLANDLVCTLPEDLNGQPSVKKQLIEKRQKFEALGQTPLTKVPQNRKAVRCKICGNKFPSRSDMMSHKFEAHPEIMKKQMRKAKRERNKILRR